MTSMHVSLPDAKPGGDRWRGLWGKQKTSNTLPFVKLFLNFIVPKKDISDHYFKYLKKYKKQNRMSSTQSAQHPPYSPL